MLKEIIKKDYKRFQESAGILMGNHDSSSTLCYFIISIIYVQFLDNLNVSQSPQHYYG